MKHKFHSGLVNLMISNRRDFTLTEIYKLVCRPPHLENPTHEQLHSRCSRAIGETRAALKRKGFVLRFGELRHSYRAVSRERRTK